ncbi:MAG: ribosome assembly RNA-binding protein YhbY [bacterium]|jgi:RNA-binding protein|nr:ribosome assembly RNA-binding protein YhbY [bacterium]
MKDETQTTKVIPTSSDQPPLKGSERKYLRGLAHHLKPFAQIGKTGLTPNVLTAIDEALEHHELIKVRFLDFKDQKQELAQAIASHSNSEIVGSVGHVFIFYRQHPEPEKRQVQLASH